jgi:2-methylcitrate dehydratase PrpD
MAHDGLVLELVDAALESASSVDARTEGVQWSLFDFATCAIAGAPHVATDWPLSEPGRLAVAAHADDRDDIHWASVTHPGGVIWPTVLTTARDAHASGDAIAQAAALGHEVMTRLAQALGGGHRRYWHATTTCGTAGAAAAAAALVASDRQTIADAVGHATSVAGGSSRALFEKSGTRLFHRSQAVDSGIAAAHAAAAGVGATRFGLEDEDGVLAALCADGDASALVERRAGAALAEVSPRLLAVSGWAHAACAAAATVGPLAPESIEAVQVDVAPAAIALAGNPQPRSREEAWWSIPHAVAIVLASGSYDVLANGRPDDPAIDQLRQRVSLTSMRSDVSAGLRVQVEGRRSPIVSEQWPPGHSNNPATPEDRQNKWLTLIGPDASEAIEVVTANLQDRDNAAASLTLQLIGDHMLTPSVAN